MNLDAIQSALRDAGHDGWLFYDHHHRDPIGERILGLDPKAHITRRWYYYIPATGEPRKLVHRIEQGRLDTLPGSKGLYSSWQELAAGLEAMLGRRRSESPCSTRPTTPSCTSPWSMPARSNSSAASANKSSVPPTSSASSKPYSPRSRSPATPSLRRPSTKFSKKAGRRSAAACAPPRANPARSPNSTWCSG